MESSPSKGSTFHIYIPLLNLKKRAAESVHTLEITEVKGELILLADDESIVRETLAEVLESMGYHVLQAEDGLQALNLFKAH